MKYNRNLHDRKSIRLRGYNYANAGAYFLTMCCQNREHLFGKIVDAKMILNEYGEIAKKCWLEIPQHFPHTVLHEFVIMPNHFHGIIEILNVSGVPNVLGVPNVVGVQNFEPLPQKNMFQKIIPRSIGSIVRGFKIGVTKQIGYPIWQRNYHERIIRSETDYTKITKYIRNNPILWGKKTHWVR